MSETTDYIKKLFLDSNTECIELTGPCQKCATSVSVSMFKSDGEVYGNGGVAYKSPGPPVFKCYECLEGDEYIINPQRCEVFSRVCGYLRPVNAYNPGKKAEFNMRTNYKSTENKSTEGIE